jgi:hypothetical protein
MAIADVSAAHEDPIRTFLKGLEDVMGRDSGGAHHPDVPHVGRILEAAHSGKIGAGVSAPVAKESEDPWFKFRHLGHSFCQVGGDKRHRHYSIRLRSFFYALRSVLFAPSYSARAWSI